MWLIVPACILVPMTIAIVAGRICRLSRRAVFGIALLMLPLAALCYELWLFGHLVELMLPIGSLHDVGAGLAFFGKLFMASPWPFVALVPSVIAAFAAAAVHEALRDSRDAG